MKKRTFAFILSIMVLFLVVSGVVAYMILRSENKSPTNQAADGSQVQTPSPASPTQTPSPTTTQPTPIPIKVYFSKHPQSDDDPSKVFPVSRTSPDLGVASYVIQQMLVGPTATEATQGYFTTVRVRSDASNCGNRDFTIVIKDTVATLRFCRTFDAIGVMSDGQAQETLKASLLQFPTIKKVIILTKDGNCQFDLSGQNFCLQ